MSKKEKNRKILPEKQKRFIDLPEKQKAFAQFVVQGMSYQSAYLAAGYLSNRNPKDDKVKRLAQQSGSMLMNNPLIKGYVYQNKALAFQPADGISIESIKTRLRQIMDCELFVPAYNKKGERIQLAPMHKDMINAADLLFKILRWEGDKPKSSVGEYELEDDLLDSSTSFLGDMAKQAKVKADNVIAEVSPIQGMTKETYEEVIGDELGEEE